MYKFSELSIRSLLTCDDRLQTIAYEAIKLIDFRVLEGHRSKERQDFLHSNGSSQLPGGKSKHNFSPSKAFDVAPYPINWKDRERFSYLAGIMIGIAHAKGIRLRWGGDWNQDGILSDNNFDDLGHFELL